MSSHLQCSERGKRSQTFCNGNSRNRTCAAMRTKKSHVAYSHRVAECLGHWPARLALTNPYGGSHSPWRRKTQQWYSSVLSFHPLYRSRGLQDLFVIQISVLLFGLVFMGCLLHGSSVISSQWLLWAEISTHRSYTWTGTLPFWKLLHRSARIFIEIEKLIIIIVYPHCFYDYEIGSKPTVQAITVET